LFKTKAKNIPCKKIKRRF